MADMIKNWKILPGWQGKAPAGDPSKSRQSRPKWLFDVLANRGLKTEQEICSFLDPKYEELLNFYDFKNLDLAAERIMLAKSQKQKVVIYGDYDVDGITSVALLSEVLSKIGIQNFETYIPHREEEGYGLNQNAVDELVKKGADLVITVDCGVTTKEIIDPSPIDFIVCDHHEIDGEKLSKKAIIVHPKLVKKGVPGQALAACGMSFFLAKGLYQKAGLPEGQEKWLLDLVALATICDVVPLTDQNRILAKWGILVLSKTKRIGLLELMKTAGVLPAEVNSYALGFLLGPRLNAAGRLDHARKALELLTTTDKTKAVNIAAELNKLNLERQKLCERILEEAKAEIESSGKKDHEVYLLSNKNWPRGVVGIIASKLNDIYTRPVIVFEFDGEAHHGSARSIEAFDITAALGECADQLVKYGGHAKAAGLTVTDEHFVAFGEKLLSIAKGKITEEDLKKQIKIDAVIEPEEITEEMVDLVESLEPFGFGNPTPVFAIKGVSIEDAKRVGANKEHLKFQVVGGSSEVVGGDKDQKTATISQTQTLSAIYFSPGEEILKELQTTNYNLRPSIAFMVRYNFWNNRKSIELRVIDLK